MFHFQRHLLPQGLFKGSGWKWLWMSQKLSWSLLSGWDGLFFSSLGQSHGSYYWWVWKVLPTDSGWQTNLSSATCHEPSKHPLWKRKIIKHNPQLPQVGEVGGLGGWGKGLWKFFPSLSYCWFIKDKEKTIANDFS